MIHSDASADIRAEQASRWTDGERLPVEALVRQNPAIANDRELMLDLIYREFLLCEQDGLSPTVGEFAKRFPNFESDLQRQVELHRALATQESDFADSRTAVAQSDPASQTPSQRRAPTRLREQFGRYRIERLIGRGGMGAVYQAHDTLLDRTVALKVILFPDDVGHSVVQRFYREARAAAGFDHPHLCRVYDVGEIDAVHFLTMPLLSGESLKHRLETRGKLPWRESVRIAATVASAVQTAHLAGVVHRDLKPSNIVLTLDDQPVVIDFGLALRQTAGESDLTPSDGAIGTPAYMAPEQIDKRFGSVGPRTDVYALGAVLFEMLSGKPLFQGTVYEVIQQATHEEPVAIESFNTDIPDELAVIVRKALRKDPLQRFSNMRELADALRAIESAVARSPASDCNAETLAMPMPVRVQGKRLSNRNRLIVATVCVTAVVISVILLRTMFLQDNDAVPNVKPDDLNDPLPANSQWSGMFKFRPPHDYSSDVQLRITRRNGDMFEGVYTTERQKFEWHVRGTLDDERIQWQFTKAIRDNPNATLVGNAAVAGTLRDGKMQMIFTMPNQQSTADMELKRQGGTLRH